MKNFFINDDNIKFYKKNAAINMAIDEMFFEFLSLQKSAFILRFYKWKNTFLSYGYTRRINNKPEILKKFTDFDSKAQNFVRRPTGGGFVEHGNDICMTIFANLQMFPILRNINDSYNLSHSIVLKCIKKLAIDCEGINLFKKNNENFENDKNSCFCFEKSVLSDIVFKNRKLVGSAQKRTCDDKKNIFFMQQTSINIKCLFLEKNFTKFLEKDSEKFIDFIKEEFEKNLNLKFENYDYSQENIDRTEYLLENKYLSDKWNKKI